MESIRLPKILLFDHKENTHESGLEIFDEDISVDYASGTNAPAATTEFRSLKDILQEDCHLYTASNNEEAFKFLREVKPDLIFLSRIELLERIKPLNSKAKIIMITGEEIGTENLKKVDLGIIHLIHKPSNIKDLRILIKKVLDQKELPHTTPFAPSGQLFSDEMDHGKTSLKETVSIFEKQLIEEALKKTKGILTHTAKLLGTTRRILKYRIDQLKIQIRKQDYR